MTKYGLQLTTPAQLLKTKIAPIHLDHFTHALKNCEQDAAQCALEFLCHTTEGMQNPDGYKEYFCAALRAIAAADETFEECFLPIAEQRHFKYCISLIFEDEQLFHTLFPVLRPLWTTHKNLFHKAFLYSVFDALVTDNEHPFLHRLDYLDDPQLCEVLHYNRTVPINKLLDVFGAAGCAKLIAHNIITQDDAVPKLVYALKSGGLDIAQCLMDHFDIDWTQVAVNKSIAEINTQRTSNYEIWNTLAQRSDYHPLVVVKFFAHEIMASQGNGNRTPQSIIQSSTELAHHIDWERFCRSPEFQIEQLELYYRVAPHAEEHLDRCLHNTLSELSEAMLARRQMQVISKTLPHALPHKTASNKRKI